MNSTPETQGHGEETTGWFSRSNIADAVAAMESGLDYVRMCLAEHDAALGRTTVKNKRWAETMEADIEKITAALKPFRSVAPQKQVGQSQPSTIMKPHQERAVLEKRELDEKRKKLATFLGTEAYRAGDAAEQNRLARQLAAMDRYSDILGERIRAFKE